VSKHVQKMVVMDEDDLRQSELHEVRQRLERLIKAVKEHLAVKAARKRMLKLYPPGTRNAEDAWRDFGKIEAMAEAELRKAATS